MLRTVRWVHRLGFRLTVLAGPIAIAAIGACAFMAIRNQEEQILAEAARGAMLLSDTIRRSIDHQMLLDNRGSAYTTLDVVARHPRIRAARMINARSEVTWSTLDDEIGKVVDLGGPICSRCHTGGTALDTCTASTHTIFEDGERGRGVAVVTPIYNEARCATAKCHAHPAEQKLLGVVGLELELDEMDASLSDLKSRMLGLSALALLALTLPAGWYFHRIVLRPIDALVSGTRRIASGDLDHVIPEESRSELGYLEHSFNSMTASLRQARKHVDELMVGLEQQVRERTDALREVQEELIHAEKMTSLGKLSASIAHEINNPLMGILTSSKLLIRSIDDAPLSERDRRIWLRQLQLVQREAERCRTIVRHLLDFARQRSLELAQIDVTAAVEEALSIVVNQLKLQGITLAKALPTGVQVRGDFGQVRQAVLNVCINACDAMPHGGTLTVQLHPAGRERRVVVEITDTGSGIPPEHLSKIFDPFFTTKEKGTGLGLSVVYGILNRHGGNVEIDSTVGVGTRIRLSFPLGGPGSTEAQQQDQQGAHRC